MYSRMKHKQFSTREIKQLSVVDKLHWRMFNYNCDNSEQTVLQKRFFSCHFLSGSIQLAWLSLGFRVISLVEAVTSLHKG